MNGSPAIRPRLKSQDEHHGRNRSSPTAWFAVLLLLLGLPKPCASAQRFEPPLSPDPEGLLWIRGAGPTNSVFRIERSSNLTEWAEWRRLIPGAGRFGIPDLPDGTDGGRFYRLRTAALGASDDWKNQIGQPEDPFSASSDASQVRWIKFLILTQDPTRVYFQDGNRRVLHYDFAKARLAQFSASTRTTFDAATLRLQGQQAVLGAVLFPPDPKIQEWGIQFAGLDPYPADWVDRHFQAVRDAVDAPAGMRAFYMPSFEQAEAAQAEAQTLATRGIPIGSVFRWVQGDQVYSAGWAAGRLRFIPATQIVAAYQDGRLLPSDILLTDGIPAEVPFVAGIVSLAPATPNSHVALYAAANSLPFAFVSDPARQDQFRRLDGHDVVVRSGTRYGYSQVTVADVDGQWDATTRRMLTGLKTPPAVQLQPKAPLGAYHAETSTLKPTDRHHFGGKSVNHGLLRRTIPGNTESGIAFSFDLWEAFLDQPVPQEGTLREAITRRISGFTNFPPDIASLQARLGAVRSLITDTASFNPLLRGVVTNALAGFDPSRKIRFRSSSNAEDSTSFVAAGLYDSYSGCLLDDLDADTTGPCACDPTEAKERGVFRAIQRVFASFYNDNAFLERLRHRIDESQVAMGVLVHYSTPDEQELANGVAQVAYQAARFGPPTLYGDLVTQAGAVSVTNPDGGAVPERVRVSATWVETPSQRSSLVPLGTTVLANPSDYTLLFGLMQKVHTAYSQLTGASTSPGALLDFEYKKVRPARLLIKQVRELPQPASAPVDPFLVNEPSTFWVFNSEQTDLMAAHRLKCLLQLETGNLRLGGTNLDQSFYTSGRFEYRIEGSRIETLTGPLSRWPEATHEVIHNWPSARTIRDSWTVGTGPLKRRCTLITEVPLVDPTEGLVITSRDLKKWLEVTYASPNNSEGTPTSKDTVRLVLAPDTARLQPGTPEVFQAGNVGVSVAFLVSTDPAQGPPLTIDPNPYGAFPAYYPCWAHATLTGILPEPVTLTAYQATTGVLGHQRRFQWFVFEPAADPGLPDSQRRALEVANLRRIHAYREPYGNVVRLRFEGFDGTWRSP